MKPTTELGAVMSAWCKHHGVAPSDASLEAEGCTVRSHETLKSLCYYPCDECGDFGYWPCKNCGEVFFWAVPAGQEEGQEDEEWKEDEEEWEEEEEKEEE